MRILRRVSHPCLIVQQMRILRRVSHPCLIKLLAVDVKRSVILLELAPQGSLRSLFLTRTQLSRILKHRMAFQVSTYQPTRLPGIVLLKEEDEKSFEMMFLLQIAEGLRFLHECDVIYRDMKPDNILIFSLQTSNLVNDRLQ